MDDVSVSESRIAIDFDVFDVFDKFSNNMLQRVARCLSES